MRDQRDRDRLEGRAGELGAPRAGGGRERLAARVGEVDGGLLEEGAVLEHPGTREGVARALEALLAEAGAAVLRLEGRADPVLKAEEPGADLAGSGKRAARHPEILTVDSRRGVADARPVRERRPGGSHEARHLHSRRIDTRRCGHRGRDRRSRRGRPRPAPRHAGSPRGGPPRPRGRGSGGGAGAAPPRARRAAPRGAGASAQVPGHRPQLRRPRGRVGRQDARVPDVLHQAGQLHQRALRSDPLPARDERPRLRGRAGLRRRPALPPRAEAARGGGDRRLPGDERRQRARLAVQVADPDARQVLGHPRTDRPVDRDRPTRWATPTASASAPS